MTSPKDDGGPFHPMTFDSRDCPSVGASYRAWAAGIAMPAVILRLNDNVHDCKDVAIEAVAYADALIAELKK